MKGGLWIILLFVIIAAGVSIWLVCGNSNNQTSNKVNKSNSARIMDKVELPQPKQNSDISVEEALAQRRSVRKYSNEPLGLEEIAQLLWAAQGVTAFEDGGRTAPSAGALYPLEVYIAVKESDDIEPGVYHYKPNSHSLEPVSDEQVNRELAGAALGQMFVAEAPAVLIITGNYSITTDKYGPRGTQYVHMEAGHAAQNVYLQAESLGLGTVTVGAFNDEEVKNILGLPKEQSPLYIMPVGHQ